MHKIEGKTKILTPLWSGAEIAVVTTKDDITAGDGAKHDLMVGKAELATRTTCNDFDYLRGEGVPMAYIGRDGPTTFITKVCKMILVEVVVRRVAMGSYCKRHPTVSEGTVLEDPVVEFFYKTTGRRTASLELPCDDPLMLWDERNGGYDLYLPNKPVDEAFLGRLSLTDEDEEALKGQLIDCSIIALDVNEYLHNAWQYLGGTLCDFKLEFGVLPDGEVVLADVVDCDSWRVIWHDIQLSKQGYRDGDDLGRVLGVYRLAAALTDHLV